MFEFLQDLIPTHEKNTSNGKNAWLMEIRIEFPIYDGQDFSQNRQATHMKHSEPAFLE